MARGVGPLDHKQEGQVGFVPEGNDDELCVLSSVLDVVRDDRHVPEIQRGVDLVHEVQRGGLEPTQSGGAGRV